MEIRIGLDAMGMPNLVRITIEGEGRGIARQGLTLTDAIDALPRAVPRRRDKL
jgi:hypothetical protein